MKRVPGLEQPEVGIENSDEILQSLGQRIHEPDIPLLHYDDFGMEETRVKVIFRKKTSKES